MATVRVTLSIDAETKEQVMPILERFGMNMSTAADIFFKAIVRERRFPIEIVCNDVKKTGFDMSEAELAAQFAEAVRNRDDEAVPEYTAIMDLDERTPYKLYPDGRKESI